MELTVAFGLFSGAVWKIVGESSTFGVFILLVLTIMSLTSWVIIANKWRTFRAAEEATDKFLRQFQRSNTLAEAVGQAKAHAASPLAGIYRAGIEEVDNLARLRNEGGGLQDSRQPLQLEDFEIVEMTMEKSLTEEMARVERRVVFLATTASSAPFMGLLGTVVGIMDSFWSIGERGSASLAIVAPGIAEALLATIVGLGAAIPAVIAYNWANNRTKRLNDMATGFILDFIARARKEQR